EDRLPGRDEEAREAAPERSPEGVRRPVGLGGVAELERASEDPGVVGEDEAHARRAGEREDRERARPAAALADEDGGEERPGREGGARPQAEGEEDGERDRDGRGGERRAAERHREAEDEVPGLGRDARRAEEERAAERVPGRRDERVARRVRRPRRAPSVADPV